jgi:diguanylate cyclase (GGDEF)-like protein
MIVEMDATRTENRERILVVDDSETNLLLLTNILQLEGYEVETAQSGPEALQGTRVRLPDLVLLDIMMPEMSGLEVCRILKSDARTSDIPIIFLTALGEVPDRVTGLEVGGDDYIAKPFHPDELRARIRAVLRTKQAHDQLRRERETLASQAVTDPLTGVYNRRLLETRLTEEAARSRRYGHRLTCLMLDLDHFKRINDQYGHPTGDAILRQFATLTQSCLRSSDILARYGGEEFVILVTGTGLEGATATAKKILRTIEDHCFQGVEGQDLRLTTSIGVAELLPGENPEQVLARADRALYEAKRTGRNRVVCA